MSLAQVLERAPQAPTRVQMARCDRAEVVAPFQYYSSPSEAIYALDFAGHDALARLLLHFDAEGVLLAQTLLADPEDTAVVAHWLYAAGADMEGLKAEGADFAALMAEMHLAAAQDSSQLYDGGQLATVRELSREAPVLIGGCGRSGTTLLLSILGAHPTMLAFADELYAFYPYPFRLQSLIDPLAKAHEDGSWRRWVEKTPKNVRAFERIHQAFNGEARLIHMVRDGRDVVTSHHPNASERYYVEPERWVADVCAGLEQADKTLLLRYEDLVAEPERTLKTVCEFIEEPFDERLLSFELHSTVAQNKAWEGGAATALHQERVERWRAPEHAARVAKFMATPGAQDTMEELGYL
ncbi:MAG: sulfotransferase [Chloroflexi bacterium]|nr:sulfotransferase [Chloroflexota bacterium]